MNGDPREHDRILSERELASLRAEIERLGFEKDPLAGEHADRPHYGLNVAVAWPLPPAVEATYRTFEARAAALDPGAYVYPFTTTHITVLTAVSFKRHADPSRSTIDTIDDAAAALGAFLAEAAGDVAPFTLGVGPPVLARAAAFLPMRNDGGEIARVRERVLAFCRAAGGVLADASAPRGIHSTVLRFREPPNDPAQFVRAFERAVDPLHFGVIDVDRLLVTLETKPYMRAGRIARAVTLVGGKSHG